MRSQLMYRMHNCKYSLPLKYIPMHFSISNQCCDVLNYGQKDRVYSNLLGFLGGVHLAILAAFVCQKHPNASLNARIMNFFLTFAFWPWPAPVILQDGMLPTTGDATETRSLMPIRLLCSPHEYCHSNITRSTFYESTGLGQNFSKGYAMTRLDFDWDSIFEPFPYTKKYTRFVKIDLSATKKYELGDWVGWVKSRFRCLLVKLEEMQGFCDPNPTEYVDMDVTEPNVVFYWGLNPSKSSYTDIESVEEDFMKNINDGYQESPGRMKLSIIQASQVPKSALRDTGSGKGTKACWKILDYNQRRIPVYSQHLPHYFVGYVVANGEPECPSGGG